MIGISLLARKASRLAQVGRGDLFAQEDMPLPMCKVWHLALSSCIAPYATMERKKENDEGRNLENANIFEKH